MDKKDWAYLGGGVAVSAGIVVGTVAWDRRLAAQATSTTTATTSGTSSSSTSSSTTSETLSAVGNLTASNRQGTLVLGWQPPQNTPHPTTGSSAVPVTYRVSTTNGLVLDSGFTGNTYAVTSLTVGQSYTFEVVAVQGSATSAPASVTATVPTITSQSITGSEASAGTSSTATAQDQYGDNLSGKISPTEAWTLFQEGKLPGPGFVVQGEWFQNLYQVPQSLRSSAQTNSAATAAQSQDTALYQKLGIIPSTAAVSSASTELAAEQRGIRALQSSGASNTVIENYLQQEFGYSSTIAGEEAAQGYPVLQETVTEATGGKQTGGVPYTGTSSSASSGSTSSTSTASSSGTSQNTPSSGSSSKTGTVPGPSGASSGPTLVSKSEVYLSNVNSCLYNYQVIGHYSNGTTKVLGTITRQEGDCANQPTVKYTFRRYASNVDSTYYTYDVIAVYTNGTEKQIGTVVVKK